VSRAGTLVVRSLVLALTASAAADERGRYDGARFSFSYPSSATVGDGADPSGNTAVAVSEGEIVATVVASDRRVGDGDIERVATEWHAARIRNRAAWGMRAHAGPPRESVRVGERRWFRWRDRIGSVLGDKEQVMSCTSVSDHLACVAVSAPRKERERVQSLEMLILSTLRVRR
jgi:hypothetical protein